MHNLFKEFESSFPKALQFYGWQVKNVFGSNSFHCVLDTGRKRFIKLNPYFIHTDKSHFFTNYDQEKFIFEPEFAESIDPTCHNGYKLLDEKTENNLGLATEIYHSAEELKEFILHNTTFHKNHILGKIGEANH